jgi:uncharacterized protein YbjT (DUF2867 family)
MSSPPHDTFDRSAEQGPSRPRRRALVSGATGFIGGRLAGALADAGWKVRCLVRERSRAYELEQCGFELHEGDVLRPETLQGAGRDVEVAYYLIHAMGRGGRGDFHAREHAGAQAFARMAAREGVGRVIYLGGLGEPHSRHLRSRHETARVLAQHGPPLTYFRAGMVVGPESESYRTLRYLVERLPAMIAPAWLKVPTQPIAIDDVLAYLAAAPDLSQSAGREIQIGGPDVLPYGEMLDRMAEALGRRPRPKLPVPLLTPRLSSLWIGLVTPVDAGVARPLIEGLSTETTVTDSSGAALFDITPLTFEEALQRAVAEDSATSSSRGTPRRGDHVLGHGRAPSHDARRRPRGCAAELAEVGQPGDGAT